MRGIQSPDAQPTGATNWPHGTGRKISNLGHFKGQVTASVYPSRFGHDVLMDAVPGLRRAVANEYRRLIRPPWEIPTVLVTNGALMAAAWFLLPPRLH